MSNEQKTEKYEFYRNMRKTPWQKLFPHWWAENDLLVNAIGDEVERIKALTIFSLLNAGIKPPVITWKESIVHKEYHLKSNLTKLSSFVTIQAPLYKTWGTITFTNNTKEDINTLKIMINEDDGLLINQLINQNDKIIFDLETQKLTINNKPESAVSIGEGIPYFKTVQNKAEYDEDTPLHNEVIRIQFASKEDIECDIDVDIRFDNIVFTDEQNVEVTGLELVPIEHIDIYAKYDFPYNSEYNGWHKVYQKKYDKNTNVLYDMITAQIYTKEWYVEVYFKGLQYPYKVGFPCYKDAEPESMYHVNNRLDTWGDLLGLERRDYKTNIAEEDYATTYPVYYPYDIEQDYWYYKRLVNEYSWNDLAINDIDLKDTEGNNLVRMHSINPFIEDFVVHAKSTYPKDKAFNDSNEYIPVIVSEQSSNRAGQQSKYYNIRNVLTYNDKEANVTLENKSGSNINDLLYQSKELWTYFDLSDLPEDINIDNIEVIVEGSSLDNKTDKYSNADTGLIIPNLYEDNITFIPLHADKNYQLRNQAITYSSNDLSTYLKELQDYSDEHVEQTAIIGIFQKDIGETVQIPFECYEGEEKITDIRDVWVYFEDVMVSATYTDGYINVTIPKTNATTMTFIVKSKTHKPLTMTIDIGKSARKQYALDEENNYITEKIKEKDENGQYILDDEGNPKEKEIPKVISVQEYIYGPLNNGRTAKISITDEWHTKDVRNIIQKQGIYFRNIFENENEQSKTTLNIQNILLKVSYSQKKSNFKIETDISYDVKAPKIAQYVATVKNTGEKPLETRMDIISAPNIQLSENSKEIDLAINEEKDFTIDIYPQSPIDDGYYDILTICEDYTKKDVIKVFGEGLIETGIKLSSHHAKYDEETTITAEIVTPDNGKVTGTNIKFYINNHIVKGNIAITDNIATMTFTPSDYYFIDTGIQKLEVIFDGDVKYSGSQATNEIFISKQSIIIEINANQNAYSLAPYTATANVYYTDIDGNQQFVTDGIVSFYANDFLIGKVSSDNGMFTINVEGLELDPGKYTLWARYSDSDTYATDEQSQYLRVFGGQVSINVFDIKASPIDNITVKAKIYDSLLEPIEEGTAIISIYYYDEHNEPVYLIDNDYQDFINGLVECECNLSTFNFGELADSTISAIIEVTFGGMNNEVVEPVQSSTNPFIETTGTGTLTISKKDVVIEIADTFNCTQYEPLGFLVKVSDANTNKPVKDGKVSINVLKQSNIIGEAEVDEDGYARIVCNPMVSVEEWDTTGEFEFVLGTDQNASKDGYLLYKDGMPIDISEYGSVDPEDEEQLLVFSATINDAETYFTIDGDSSSPTYQMLVYYPKQESIDEFFFIDPDTRELYRQTSTKSRLYQKGQYTVRFTYTDSKEYKTKNKISEKGLIITESEYDLDLHSYKLTYDTTHDIICYISTYDGSIVENGKIVFYIDDKKFYEANVESSDVSIPASKIENIKYGNHLIKACYMINNNPLSYTYALLEVEKITPIVTYNEDFCETLMKGETNELKVYVKILDEEDKIINSAKEITGFVNIYLDDELIAYQYLYGNEGYYGIINQSYTTDDIGMIEGYENEIIFNIPIPDDIDVNPNHYIKIEYEGNNFIEPYTTRTCYLEPVALSTTLSTPPTSVAYGQKATLDIEVQTESNYIVDKGFVIISDGNDTILDKVPVRNNQATITWIPNRETNEYVVYYVGDNILYKNSKSYNLSNLHVSIIEPQSLIQIKDNEEPTYTFNSFKDIIQCLEPNGEIHIETENPYIIESATTIDKPVNITGTHDSILKLNENLIINSNVNIIDTVIESDDNKTIVNKGTLKIICSILGDNLTISSTGILIVNRSLVYCKINSTRGDLNNNWWGQNIPPYSVDNHLILTLETSNSPAVISDDINIIGKIIGANNREYTIPEVNFMLTADTGYFSIDNGKMINHEVQSTYFDATEEGKIYLTVDNETVECQIYDYERKTEVILDPITDIPVDNYITFNAYVYSVVDSYDNYSDIQGYMDFYFDDKHIGRDIVSNNFAQISLYTKGNLPSNEYSINEPDEPHKIKAEYTPIDEHFGSSKEKNVNIIKTNNVYYVAPNVSDDYGDGSFSNPFKTIQKAINEAQAGYTIFLKDGQYTETEIDINKSITIQSYSNNVSFNNKDTHIFNIQANNVTLNKINFTNNQASNLIINQGSNLAINQSLFYNNEGEITTGNATISYSAIIEQQISANHTYRQCWFGTNDPREDLGNQNINNYVVMTASKSKSELYKGVIALVRGELLQYKTHNGNEVSYNKVDKDIPLRIAEFSSEQASLQPLKDYTHSNYATSLLNTNVDSNSSKYRITISNNEYYIDEKVEINCLIEDALTGDAITQGTVQIVIENNTSTIYDDNVNIDNGEATIKLSPLKNGIYNITCIYADENSITKMQDIITIKKYEVELIDLTKEYNNRAMSLSITLQPTKGNIDDETIKIYIDDEYIDSFKTENNVLASKRIEYSPLNMDAHKIKLIKNESSKYDYFKYEETFRLDSKITPEIVFGYDKIQKGVENSFTVYVKENEIDRVVDGYITVVFGEETIAIDEKLTNGTYTFPLQVEEEGQYSMFVYYHDESNRYNNVSTTFNVDVNIFPVNLENLPDPITMEIGEKRLFKYNVIDSSYRPVLKGYFNVYIDDIFIQKVNVTIGQFVCELELPKLINAGEHQLKLEYIDATDDYLDTIIYRTLNVSKIRASIKLGVFAMYPNQNTSIPFSIVSDYGQVNTGMFSLTITDEHDNEKTYTRIVSDNLVQQIDFIAPNLPSGEYELIAQYTDESGNYQDAVLNQIFTMGKNTVNIAPKYTGYYPQKEFIYSVDITNQDNRTVDSGYIDIYIDNVKEKENIVVKNGQASTKLSFNMPKTYKIDIIYYDDDNYYDESSYTYNFIVDRMDIIDIDFNRTDEKITEITFETLDNNDVNDGILYVYINGVQMNAYNIIESHKFIDLDISYLPKGTHEITLQYVGSRIYNDCVKSKTIEIEALTPILTIENITAENNIDIDITGSIDTTGIIKFYICNTEQADCKFIGLVNGSNNFTYSYRLPQTIIAGNYKIKAEFTGNDKYDGAEAYSDLTVQKQDIPIYIGTKDTETNEYTIIETITDEYLSTINIPVCTEIPNALINLALAQVITKETEEEIKIITDIDTIVVNEEKDLQYKLPQDLIGEYRIIATYKGSPIYEEQTASCKLLITPHKPILTIEDVQANIGGTLLLDNEIENIHSGKIKYSFDDIELEYDAGTRTQYQLSESILNNFTINAQYISDDENKFLDSDEITFTVHMNKNDVHLDAHAPMYINLDEVFNVEVEMSSTSTLPIDVNITASYNSGTIKTTNNIATIPCMIPSGSDDSEYEIIITTDANDIFKSATTKSVVRINEKDYITVNNQLSNSNTNTQTLSQAIALAKDNGIIEIITPVSNENVNIDKNLTITGTTDVSGTNITINKEVNINGLNFKTSSITNNGTTTINECTFSNNTTPIITNNDNMTIANCIFTNNNITNGSCINITTPNAHTTIDKCTFNYNNGSPNASCIFSNRVNEVEISNTKFINNNSNTTGDTCIYIYGNMALYKNIFYNNTISVLKGEIIAEKNIFYADNSPIQFYNIDKTNIDIDLNYWGDVQSREDISIDENVEINNWLIGSLLIKEDETKLTITPVITQYVNTLEVETTDIEIHYDPFEVDK